MMRVFSGAAILFLMVARGSAQSPENPDLASRAEAQKAARAQIDQVTRRMETVLRALRYQGLQGVDETALLEDASRTLSSLGQKEMTEVVDRLRRASAVPENAPVEVAKAHARHQEILSRLLEVSLRRQALRSLAEASARARKAAVTQEKLLETMAGEAAGATSKKPDTREAIQARQVRLLDSQRDLATEVGILMRQAAGLEEGLDARHREMLKKGLDEAKNQKLIEHLGRIQQMVARPEVANDRKNQLRPPMENARIAIQALFAIARHWRSEDPEELALRQLRDSIARTEEDLADASENQPMDDGKETVNRDKAEKQTAMQQEAKDLADRARLIQKSATPAEQPLREASNQLRAALEQTLAGNPKQGDPLESRARQELAKAREKVEEALRKKLEERLAKRQQEHGAKLDSLIKRQEDLNKKTEAAAKDSKTKPEEIAKLAANQADLARQAAQLAAEAPDQAEGEALAEAARDQAAATRDLADKESPENNAAEARPDQARALAQLQKARKDLAELVAKNNTSRERQARHEKAAEKLEDAARKQAEIAQKAKDLSEKGALKDAPAAQLAQDQDRVKNQVGEALREIANDKDLEGARAEAGEAMTEQKNSNDNLRANRPAEAATDAREAAEALAEAARQARDLAQKDAAAQALAQALQARDLEGVPQAAKRLEQALEDARNARDQARKAESSLDNRTANLAREQARLAQALRDKPETADAADPAGSAATELKQGDLEGAMEAQRAALEKLRPSGGKATPDQQVAEKAQQKLLEATGALAKSAAAAETAQTGSEQAEGLVPEALLPGLDKAEKALAAGRKAAKAGDAREAATRQEDAVKGLEQALAQLAALAQALEDSKPDLQLPADLALANPMGEGPKGQDGQPMQPPMPMDSNAKPGKDPAQTGKESGPAQLRDPEGAGRFLRLPAREREALLQAWTEGLPPAHAALVQRYFRDLARNAASQNPKQDRAKP